MTKVRNPRQGAGATGRFQRLGSEVTPLHEDPEIVVRVQVQVQPAYVSDWLPTVGELTSLELDYTDGRTNLSEVRYTQATSTGFVLGVDPRDEYEFTSVLTPVSLERSAEPAKPDPGQRQPDGEFLDGYLQRWVARKADPLRALRGFTRALARDGRVRLGGTNTDLTPAGLRRMLEPPQIVGTPHQYGAVVALAASRLGFQAAWRWEPTLIGGGACSPTTSRPG